MQDKKPFQFNPVSFSLTGYSLPASAGYRRTGPVCSEAPEETLNDTNNPTVTGPLDTGLDCLLVVASYLGLAADRPQLQHVFGTEKFSSNTILLAAQHLGLRGERLLPAKGRLDRLSFPVIASMKDGTFVILGRLDSEKSEILVHEPGMPIAVHSVANFSDRWDGAIFAFTDQNQVSPALSHFDFTWFIPAVVKYRSALYDVLLISLVIQLLALVTPMFFQVVMDKVLVNQAMKTLHVIGIGLVGAIIFDIVLSSIRQAVLARSSSKMDVELGARLFGHLLSLPVSYFHARRVGDSVARVRELEQIREFLTSNAVTLLLDVLFSFVFLGVMVWYSPRLTWVVLASLPLYVILSFVFTPVLRKRLNEKFLRGAENQSFLVETLSGMDTVKSMAVEPRWQQRWDKQLAAYVSAGLASTHTGILASGGVSLVSKLVTAAIMWIGALEVIENRLTVGELVAFNMLAGQVSSPILRMAQLWNDFQQVGISMSRLGDILNTRTEIAGTKTRMPRMHGSIAFEHVSFRYRPDASDVIRDFVLHIAPGEVIGIVGRSGSGKSTLTKLLQRLYVPDRGRVLVDGQDISIVDTASLRQQMGVVLQDNTLFSRSVRDNIALANPGLSIEAVMEAAQLAGAHEFICALPEGYDTEVGENGVGLSGGQRQRIAIARALISDPRILIFDEATSALDYESEKVIQDNMRHIAAGRTVLIIAHRLSAVRDADRIVVVDQGHIAETGTHAQLLALSCGIYRHLHALQSQIGGTDKEHTEGHA